MLVATGLAITRQNLVHAVVYLIISFFGSAMLYYLFGAPLLAALEIIIYAGAVMVLFLFIIMMLRVEPSALRRPSLREWFPAGILGIVYLAVTVLVVTTDPGSQTILETALAKPRVFGRFLFQKYWLSVEIISFLLLIALIGALYLGKAYVQESGDRKEDES
ncbi:MAG: NADH-ubiquinone/plastoquinone oxidoreductase subunit 6 [Gammaproteobacteria bacterium]|nr:NADH-ubiquinone/plastoquinone oxidoreductase subunit 6 [Gammaproteobacteria bacterium]